MCRYNVYKRVETLVKKMISKKKISLDATFLPKRKRVLNNKHTLRVLNKPLKRTKPAKQVDALLDSQLSIGSCLFDSQASHNLSSPSLSSPVSLMHTHTHYLWLLFVLPFCISGPWAFITSAFTEFEFAGLRTNVTESFTRFEFTAEFTSYMFTAFASNRLLKQVHVHTCMLDTHMHA